MIKNLWHKFTNDIAEANLEKIKWLSLAIIWFFAHLNVWIEVHAAQFAIAIVVFVVAVKYFIDIYPEGSTEQMYRFFTILTLFFFAGNENVGAINVLIMGVFLILMFNLEYKNNPSSIIFSVAPVLLVASIDINSAATVAAMWFIVLCFVLIYNLGKHLTTEKMMEAQKANLEKMKAEEEERKIQLIRAEKKEETPELRIELHQSN